jgi:hypothetical protein
MWWGVFESRAQIVPPVFVGGVAGYCAKYCVKEAYERGWWNVLAVANRRLTDGLLTVNFRHDKKEVAEERVGQFGSIVPAGVPARPVSGQAVTAKAGIAGSSCWQANC